MRFGAKTRRIALGAMLTSLSVVLMYLGTVIEVLDLTCCACASFVTVFAVIEFSRRYACGVYAATLILSALVVPNKFEVAAYAFIALYSILKSVIEKKRSRFSWVIKLLYFNVVLALALVSAKYLFLSPDLGFVSVISFALLGNIAFVLFDIALTSLITLYIFKLRARLKLDKYLSKMR
ncbi:MAG: hypothetical protein IJD67_06165 [Clostridia bacterium]|nr:hypothetical protein [Clostridia bacterium]